MTEVTNPEPEQPVSARAALQAENRAIVERFSREGDTIGMDSVLALRVDVLVDVLLPEGGMFREAFETAFEATLNQRLKELDQQRTRSKLTAGIDAPLKRVLD